jgi:hypothetical protein
MTDFDPSRYAPAVAQLLSVPRLNPLDAGRAEEAARAQLEALADERVLLPLRVRRRDLWDACRAGLFLHFNFLDESHRISQDLHTAEGSYWHAILHRREPDAANSKYWWKRVGAHPVLLQLRESSPEVGYRFTAPEAFVDFCENVRNTGSADEEVARRVQQLEWDLLFAWCYERAGG